MSKYRIAWLPGDGIGNDVMEATRHVLDSVELDAEYVHGDIGWDFWCQEGDAFPARTVELLKSVDAAFLLHEFASQCERITDHCTNIAEQVIYSATGAIIRHTEGHWHEVATA